MRGPQFLPLFHHRRHRRRRASADRRREDRKDERATDGARILTSHSRLVLLASAHACVRTHLQPPFSHSVRSRDTVAGWSRWLLRSFLLEMDASVGRAGKRRKSRTDGRNCRRVTATDVADDKQCHACLYKISSNELPTPLPSFISTLTNACRSSSWASKGKIKGKISPFA